jgi:mannose-6-phosphate isomerase-like protein (cupin superfamily)
LRVIEGAAEVFFADERAVLECGDAVTIPAGAVHGFTNTGATPLRVLAILASPIFEAHYTDPPRDSRRWMP